MIEKLQFWTLVVALLTYVLRFFFPGFPLDETQILSIVLFLLGLFGVVPQLRFRGLAEGTIFASKAFWTLVAGLIVFVVHFYAPDFPLDQAVLLSVIVFVLNQLGINPELRSRGLMS